MTTTNIAESIHGHEVVNLILAAPEGISPADLDRKVRDSFGNDARFHTCSASNMTLADLLVFLHAKGKISQVGDRVVFDRSKMCNH